MVRCIPAAELPNNPIQSPGSILPSTAISSRSSFIRPLPIHQTNLLKVSLTGGKSSSSCTLPKAEEAGGYRRAIGPRSEPRILQTVSSPGTLTRSMELGVHRYRCCKTPGSVGRHELTRPVATRLLLPHSFPTSLAHRPPRANQRVFLHRRPPLRRSSPTSLHLAG